MVSCVEPGVKVDDIRAAGQGLDQRPRLCWAFALAARGSWNCEKKRQSLRPWAQCEIFLS